jgi:hypothetical protein
MIHWNYRVFHTLYGTSKEDEEDGFDIREVYYDDNGDIAGISSGGCSPYGDSEKELTNDLKHMCDAFLKPFLTPKDIPNYEYGKHERPLP